jgi:ABC-type transport system involved in multi-copper enzyme maturation permease subunit
VTILPLIERELRARARKPVLYWARFAVAFAGTLACLPALALFTGLDAGTQSTLGQSTFRTLVDGAFMLCSCAGFLAVDGISRERNEGTLDLLLLTRVGIFDVLWGSFGALGITCLCALLAFLPMLMLPVLMGGVTGGEAARTALVLLDTLFLSVAAGLWAAARGRNWFVCARSVLGLLLLVVLGPILLIDLVHAVYDSQQTHGLLMEFLVSWVRSANSGGLAFISPLITLHRAADAPYRLVPQSYWLSLSGVFGISSLLLMAAGLRLRRTMQEPDLPRNGSQFDRSEGVEKSFWPNSFILYRWEVWRKPISPISEGIDPIIWLLERRRGIRIVVWVGAFAEVLLFFRESSFSLAASVVRITLFGWAASRFLLEARRTGELELLKTTPIGAASLVSSQWTWLKWIFSWPVILVLTIQLVFETWIILMAWLTYHSVPRTFLSYEPVALVELVASIAATIWVALWSALKARSQLGALVWIILLAEGVPYLLSNLGPWVFLMMMRGLTPNANYGWAYFFLSSYWLSIPYFLWLIWWARKRVRAELGPAKPTHFRWRESIARTFSSEALYR